MQKCIYFPIFLKAETSYPTSCYAFATAMPYPGTITIDLALSKIFENSEQFVSLYVPSY